ncbi:MAG: hypothetical protein JW863_20110 [Chitinispirillaceae bacterium]|nr:hypothetical protein [Chitinispirillaceae bacterium]
MAYAPDQDVITGSSGGNMFALGELMFRVTPRKIRGFEVDLGRLLWTGSYAGIFDQMPLEQFSFDGAVFSWFADPANEVSLNYKIGIGTNLCGRSISFSDTTGYEGVYFQYMGKMWRRLHGIGSFSATWKNDFSVKAIGGYQRTPKLETEVKIGSAPGTKMKTTLPESDGWHAGLELSGRVGKSDHFITLAYGRDDVLLGWSAPSYIDRKINHFINSEPFAVDEVGIHTFSRKGCSLLHGAWWMDLRRGRLKGSAGVWAAYSVPAEAEATYIFQDIDTVSGFIPVYDTVSVYSRHSRTAKIKGALDFSYRIAGPLYMGLRGDIMHYHNPDAHSNVLELGQLVNDFFM